MSQKARVTCTLRPNKDMLLILITGSEHKQSGVNPQIDYALTEDLTEDRSNKRLLLQTSKIGNHVQII